MGDGCHRCGGGVYAHRARLAARDQPEHARAQVGVAEDARKDALRPVVLFRGSEVYRRDAQVFENVGAGAALHINVEVSVFPVDDRARTDSDFRSRVVTRAQAISAEVPQSGARCPSVLHL